jgi:two-component system LytT family response regulator
MNEIGVLVVDDEPLARQRLQQMLADHADVAILGEAEDVEQAREMIREHRPDLILLDIRMPGSNGLALVEGLHVTPMPYVIFVTAHAEHAVEAFDAEAVDYLLKPFDEERLARALERARAAITRRRGSRHVERFAVTVGRLTRYVAAREVDWIEGYGNYAKLHIGKGTHLVRTTLAALEQELDPSKFVRVHRSAIVSLDRVRELRSLGGGEYRVLLVDGTQVPMSQRYRDRLP